MKKWCKITEFKAGMWMCSIVVILMIILMYVCEDSITEYRSASRMEKVADQFVYEVYRAIENENELKTLRQSDRAYRLVNKLLMDEIEAMR